MGNSRELILPNSPNISLTWSSLTFRVKLVTKIEWRCSGLPERERLRRKGERERLLAERGEGDLEWGDLSEALFQNIRTLYCFVFSFSFCGCLRLTFYQFVFFGLFRKKAFSLLEKLWESCTNRLNVTWNW